MQRNCKFAQVHPIYSKKATMRFLSIFLLFALIISCKDGSKATLTAQEIVDKSIAVSGGENYNVKSTSFEFRNIRYKSSFKGGRKLLQREQRKDSTLIKDILCAGELRRYENDASIEVADTTAVKYANSVNSVHYFARLPFGLNDAAVNKKLLGQTEINNKAYYKIEITFDAENGGEDFDDVYLYWIEKNTFKPDYLAYVYHTDGGGQRFRVAKNERYVGGIRFVDYDNLKPKKDGTNFKDIDELYTNGELEKLSSIELNDIKVWEEVNPVSGE